MHRYAEVLVDLVSNAVDRPFHYSIPTTLLGKIRPGQQVTVPLGSRRCRGYVLRLLEESDVRTLRDIDALDEPEPLLTGEQLALVPWLAMRCYCRKIDVVHAIVPAAYRAGRRPLPAPPRYGLSPTTGEGGLERAPAQRAAVRLLEQRGPLDRFALSAAGVGAATIRALLKKNLITPLALPSPLPSAGDTAPATEPLPLLEEQVACFGEITRALGSGRFRDILLHGVTASGKTEIYMQGIALCLEQGRGAIVLVPEISLTPQMIEHFEGRFPGRVAVLHSRLSSAEKARQWQMIENGKSGVVLGARSAVFAPLRRVGLIIIDEEHETTYKQDEAPRYHARDVARWRARRHKAVLLSGSATPSLESYHRALEGEAQLLTMKERVTPSSLPPVQVVDMRRELKDNHRHIFSRVLLEELNRVVERGEQALLFINRRGFSGFVLCRDCGYVVRCSSCDVSMTLHRDRGLMCCHYCGCEEAVPSACPGCGGIRIRYFSAGTQRVEDEVKALYPDLSLIRMDRDTTSGRTAHSRYYRQFKEGRASILIGTQMIAKGLDFPGVTLVGVVAADTALNLPDFRAPERTFQLLTQVAGRTARGPGGGKVIVQTYHPEHHSILAAARHDYRAFFDRELENRRQLSYPPFSDLIRFLFSGFDEKSVFEAASRFTALLEPRAADAEILGPAPASIYRIKDRFRVQTILKGEALHRQAPRFRKTVLAYREIKPALPVRLAIDYNPLVVL